MLSINRAVSRHSAGPDSKGVVKRNACLDSALGGCGSPRTPSEVRHLNLVQLNTQFADPCESLGGGHSHGRHFGVGQIIPKIPQPTRYLKDNPDDVGVLRHEIGKS